jgi:hypothetical protein
VLTYRLLARNGRLGNQLWQIASTIGIAHARGERAVFPYWRYRPYFSVPDEFFPEPGPPVDAEDLGHDWLQELGYFSAIEPLIRDLFTPSPLAWEPIADYHRDLLGLPHRTAVHVRRTDYLDRPDLFRPLGRPYYEAAMAAASPPYLVFSDDIDWCRGNFPSECIFMEDNRDYEDLLLMASCHEVIAANSTFSWWGAWLSPGRRIFPRRWYGPGMPTFDRLSAKLDPELMFPDDAIVIDA